MTTTSKTALVAGVLTAGLILVQALAPSAQTPPSRQAVTDADYQRWKTELSNWGRWGKDDEIGALNLITPAKRKRAASLVTEGVSVSLSADADSVAAVDNPSPYEVVMQGISSDRIAINYHGIAHTHLDSLAHINERGVFYNGYTPDPEAVAKSRHSRNSIHNVKNGIFTRGILIDIPRLKGVPYLEPGTSIYVEDLEAWEKQAGVKVRPPATRCSVRTGVWARRKALGRIARRAEGRPVGGARPFRDSVAQAARCRGARQRSPAVRLAVESSRRRPRFRAGVPRRAPARQLRSRSPRHGRRSAQTLGVPAVDRSAGDTRRNRIARESHRDVLKQVSGTVYHEDTKRTKITRLFD